MDDLDYFRQVDALANALDAGDITQAEWRSGMADLRDKRRPQQAQGQPGEANST